VIGALGRLTAQYPQHTRSMKLAGENTQEIRQPPVPVSGTTREMLAQLPADEKQ